jgi:hypothetical protein
LAEIARRNELRRASDLPSLSVVKELRRMKSLEDREEFEQFAAPLREAVCDQILRKRRRTEGNPNWRPSFIEGMSWKNEVSRILRERFREKQRNHSRGIGLCPLFNHFGLNSDIV